MIRYSAVSIYNFFYIARRQQTSTRNARRIIRERRPPHLKPPVCSPLRSTLSTYFKVHLYGGFERFDYQVDLKHFKNRQIVRTILGT